MGDVCVLFLSLMIAFFLNPKIGAESWKYLNAFKFHFIPMGLVYLVVNYIADLYDYQQDYRRWWNIAHVFIAGLIGALANIVLFYFPMGQFVGRTALVLQASSYTLFMALWRYAFSSLALPERLRRRLLIVGAGSSGARILQALRNRPRFGLEVQGFVDDDPTKVGSVIEGLPVLGKSSRLQELVSKYRVDLVVVAITHEKSQQLINTLTRVSWNGVEVVDMPNFYEHLAGKLPIDHLSDVWLLFNGLNKNKLYCRHLKRFMDLVVAGVLLLTHAPLLALIAAAVKWDSRGPVFYRQERLGYEGRPFSLIKFRTMIQERRKI